MMMVSPLVLWLSFVHEIHIKRNDQKGVGASHVTGCPVTGCGKDNLVACKHMAFSCGGRTFVNCCCSCWSFSLQPPNPARELDSPYTPYAASFKIGYSKAAQCARSWYVRPVWGIKERRVTGIKVCWYHSLKRTENSVWLGFGFFLTSFWNPWVCESWTALAAAASDLGVAIPINGGCWWSCWRAKWIWPVITESGWRRWPQIKAWYSLSTRQSRNAACKIFNEASFLAKTNHSWCVHIESMNYYFGGVFHRNVAMLTY